MSNQPKRKISTLFALLLIAVLALSAGHVLAQFPSAGTEGSTPPASLDQAPSGQPDQPDGVINPSPDENRSQAVTEGHTPPASVDQAPSGQPDQPDEVANLSSDENRPPASTDGNTPAQPAGGWNSSQGGRAPDDNPTSGESLNAPNLSFTYYQVAGSTFRGKSSTTSYAYDAKGCIHETGSADQLNTELQLPEGAIIKYLRLYYIDTNASAGVNGFITFYGPGSSSTDLILVSSTGSSGYGFIVSNEVTHTVSNSSYAYTLIGWPTVANSTVQLCGMRVAYYYTPSFPASALPVLLNNH